MTLVSIDSLAELLQHDKRAAGAPNLAALVGAVHLCLFIRDPEFNRFLPGPGFPQRLPRGMEWTAFLRKVTERCCADQELHSPFTNTPTRVSGCLLSDTAVAVVFGDSLRSDWYQTLAPALRVIAALMHQEVHTKLAEIRASLSRSLATESRQLAQALSEAHDKLSTALQARESLTAEIQRQEEKLHLAHRISGIGVWELHPATRIISLSSEASAIFGLPLGRFAGPLDRVIARVHPDDQDRVAQAVSSALAGDDEHNLQFRVLWPNGIMRWVENRGSVVRNADRTPATMIGLSLDITQRILTEETLIRSEKLAAAGRLAASIAHEINNPLAGLTNLIYLARNETNPDQIRTLLTTADHELMRISSVARQALSFYRDLNTPARFDLNTALQQVLDLSRNQIRQSGVVLRAQFTEQLTELDGWPGEIKQALSNLLINAVHASESGAVIRLRIYRTGQQLRLIIADHGHGIAVDHLQRIFEPFFSTKKDSGTGLGLWVTRQIVEKHGGSIRVRSSTREDRHGTVFQITLPAAGSAPDLSAARHLRYRWLELGA